MIPNYPDTAGFSRAGCIECLGCRAVRHHRVVWFRLLRSLLEELNTPISRCGAGSRSLRAVWKHCGPPLRAGRQTWQPFEALDWPAQLQMLEVAATAMKLIEAEAITPQGAQAELFLPGPRAELTSDRLMHILRRKAGKAGQRPRSWSMTPLPTRNTILRRPGRSMRWPPAGSGTIRLRWSDCALSSSRHRCLWSSCLLRIRKRCPRFDRHVRRA